MNDNDTDEAVWLALAQSSRAFSNLPPTTVAVLIRRQTLRRFTPAQALASLYRLESAGRVECIGDRMSNDAGWRVKK